GTLPASLVLGIGVLAAGCGTSQPTAPRATSRPAAEAARCEAGTLGLEAAPITRPMRKKLGLAEGSKGAVVTEVFPGGPAAAAGAPPWPSFMRRESTSRKTIAALRLFTSRPATSATRRAATTPA